MTSFVSRAASATGESIKVGGAKAYSRYIKPGNSYWVDGSSKGVTTGAAPEGMYMVTSGTHFESGCCFDYGNSETGRAYEYSRSAITHGPAPAPVPQGVVLLKLSASIAPGQANIVAAGYSK